MAMNSEPKELVSTPVCFLDIQNIGADFRYIRKPGQEFRVMESVAWSASTKALVTNPSPRGSGISGGKGFGESRA